MSVSRAEVCVAAAAEAWRGDGEIAASPMGTVPTIGARLARATFSPDLLLTDGEAQYVRGEWAVGDEPSGPVEGWSPFRSVFDLVWTGRRHVMMGASQIDRFGNTNISAIGDFHRPKVQLLGARGAPGNTISHPTSYWLPKHSPRVFVPTVDFVSGVGYDRAANVSRPDGHGHELRRIVTNLAVLDFGGSDHTMRLVSVHPGVSVDDVVAATGFELEVPDSVGETPTPDTDALALIREVLDPRGARDREVPS